MNLFLILIPQSLNSQFLNLAPYSHYDEDGVQKSDIALRSNNEVCRLIYSSEKIENHSMLNIPVKLFEKYRSEKELKEGDALIAAFAEFAQVDYLISENRHVYRDLAVREFTPVNAQEFLKILEEE